MKVYEGTYTSQQERVTSGNKTIEIFVHKNYMCYFVECVMKKSKTVHATSTRSKAETCLGVFDYVGMQQLPYAVRFSGGC